MSAFHDNILLGASGQQGYQISRSVRFRKSASAYFNRTLTTPTNNLKWTFSCWFKRGELGSNTGYTFLNAGTGSAGSEDYISYQASGANPDVIIFAQANGSSTYLVSSQKNRDPSAWMHLVFAYDSANATSSNRALLYINGVQVTAFSTATYPTSSLASQINSAVLHRIGCRTYGIDGLYDGYMTEINFVDGQTLTPTSFGQFDSITGVWGPKKYTGTYGNNGFYLNFSDNSAATAAAIGKDYSGNGNNWTPNNISVTTGATYDSMIDVPTPYADGGNGRGNYAVFNAVAKASSQPTFSNGNLNLSASSAWNGAVGTIGVTSGKWYWEVVNGNSDAYVGICGDNLVLGTADPQTLTGAILYYGGDGEKRVDGAMTAYGASYSTETIGVALDVDGGTVTFYKNNASQGSISLSSSTLNGRTIFPFFVKYASTATVNFGQRPFVYTPPTGFVALCTQNMSAPNITNGAKYFAATTYTGTGAVQSITNGGNNTLGTTFKPDFVWIKSRSNAYSHKLYDSVRGVYKELNSDSTAAEATDTNQLTSFNSNGWSVGSGLGTNGSGSTFVGWQWQAGQGSTSSNTSGSITSTVSVNTTAGFSVVTWTGTGANATVGHGLGVAPNMVIVKNRSTGSTDWSVWNKSVSDTYGAAYCLFLELTNGAGAYSGVFNSTAPTSSVFSIGTSSSTNTSSNNYVAYCFAAVAGYSAFGSYTGNGSADGPFVFCGFRPRFILIKRTDTGGYDWVIYDTSRNTYNAVTLNLDPNSSAAETNTGSNGMDILSNGFKIRDTSAFWNASGGTYIYAAFAENPFKYALAR